MQISDEAKEFLKKNLQYSPDSGRLVWKSNTVNAVCIEMRPGIGGCVYTVEEIIHGKFYVLPAASVCWFLAKDEWPEYGVTFKDRKDPILRLSNLKKCGKRDYEKLTRKTVDVDLLERMLVLLQETVDKKTAQFVACDEDFGDLVDREMGLMKEIEEVLRG